ncbi:MAG: hypothetical protein RLY50_44 [Actinomycetota bacterium]
MRTLVIDVGTSGLRAGLIHDDGRLTDLHHVQNPPSSPAPGLVEFDAAEMWQQVLEVSLAAAGDDPVDAVGITNQRASVIGWRRSTGEPIGPALGWQDLRTVGDCITMRATHGIAVAPNQSATKIAWLSGQFDGDRDDLAFGTVDTWLAWKLTNGAAHVTDHTNASVTGLVTPDATDWHDPTLDALGIDRAWLPRIVPTRGHIAAATAIPGAPPIAALVGDQQASLVGQGCISPGRAKITFGTGGMLDLFVGDRIPSSSARTGSGTFPIVAHSWDSGIAYGSEAIMLSAGTSVEWLVDSLGVVETAGDSDAIAAAVATTDGAVFVPALLGLGTPHWDYGARGSLFGVTRGTTRAHLVRAVLEGVAHRGVDLLEAAEADSSVAVPEIRVDGGMSRNVTFVQALADAAARPVLVSPVTEATTLGAGFLAGVATGQWPALESVAETVAGVRRVEPLGEPGLSRQQWHEAVSRSLAWIPNLSALDF